MINILRSKFTSGNSCPVTKVSISLEEFNQLQKEWESMVLSEAQDYHTHHEDWVTACKIAKAVSHHPEDTLYWQHQLNTLNQLKIGISGSNCGILPEGEAK